MKWLFVCVYLFTVRCANLQLKPGRLECLPEVLPEEPQPVPVVGLITGIIIDLQVRSLDTVKLIEDLETQGHRELIDFIRRSGGPGANTCGTLQFLNRQLNKLWQSIQDVVFDLTWSLELRLREAYGLIEHEFRLVIDQPLVRSWIRELRDLTRIGRNLSVQSIQNRRLQLTQSVQQYINQLITLIQSGQCKNPDVVNERFYRILNVALAESSDIINQLKLDQSVITANLARRGLDLANNIYQVETLALKNLLT